MSKWIIIITSLIVLGCQNQQPKSFKKSTKQVVKQVPLVFPDLPESIEFAGQTIHLKDEDIRERLDREVLMTAYYQSAWVGALKRAHRFFPEIEKILKEEGIPNDFKYLAIIESNLLQAVSPVGAQGFWQFMPATAKMYGLEMTADVDERLHIEKSTRAACKFLKDMQRSLNDWVLTTAAYNRGIGGVKEDMKWQKSEHYFDSYQNSETARYVFRLLATKIIYENPNQYGYYPEQMELYEPIRVQRVLIEESIPNLSDWSLDQGINIKILRKLNPWLKSLKLPVKAGKKYTILLPTASENIKRYRDYN